MAGLTDLFHIPFPVPVTVPPLLLSVKVHAPLAVMVPLMLVLPPLQMVVVPVAPVGATDGVFTVTVTDAQVVVLQVPL